MTIHFICRGNALRSSLAEAYLNSLQRTGVQATSSGTSADSYREQNGQLILDTVSLLEGQGLGQYAKRSPVQLTQERVESSDLLIYMNQRVADEARQLIDSPVRTETWSIDDIGEGNRIPQTPEDKPYLIAEVYEEVKQAVNELVAKLKKESQLTLEEIETTTTLLKKLEPGLLPEPIFIALSRLVVMVAVEFLVLRKTDAGVEILLTQRPDDDPIWPSKWHSPGTIIRPTDSSLQSCFDRLYKDELGGMDPLSPRPVGISYGTGDRGTGLTMEYVLDASDIDVPTGRFFSLHTLPENCIQEQLPMWKRAISSFV